MERLDDIYNNDFYSDSDILFLILYSIFKNNDNLESTYIIDNIYYYVTYLNYLVV